MASSWDWKNIVNDAKGTGGNMWSAAKRVGGNLFDFGKGSVKAGATVGAAAGGAVNGAAKVTAKSGLSALNVGAKLIDNPVGAFVMTVAITVAAVSGIKSLWDKRKARKAQEAALNSPDGQAMMQGRDSDLAAALEAQKQARIYNSGLAGASTEVPGDMALKFGGRAPASSTSKA